MTRKPKINNKLINLTFIYFDAVIQGERPRTYLLTTTEGREGLNAGIPESKALFVVWKGEWLRRLLVTICDLSTDK